MDEKKPLISIIVPVYNVEDYIEECLESLVKQTYKNLEIILIDDGSTDNSGEICDDYVLKDTRIKCFHQINQGVGAARNKGLEVAEGELIGFVDPDDYCDLEMFLEMFLEMYKSMKEDEADIVCCRWITINRGLISGVSGYEFAEQKKILSNLDMAEFYVQSMDWPVWNKLLKKNVVKSIKFPEIRYNEDFFTVFQWLYNASKIVYINKPLYNYRILRKGSITENRDTVLMKNTLALEQLKLFEKN